MRNKISSRCWKEYIFRETEEIKQQKKTESLWTCCMHSLFLLLLLFLDYLFFFIPSKRVWVALKRINLCAYREIWWEIYDEVAAEVISQFVCSEKKISQLNHLRCWPCWGQCCGTVFLLLPSAIAFARTFFLHTYIILISAVKSTLAKLH